MIIDLKNVKKVYRTDKIETTALDDVNLQVAEGEFVSIMGPSGCGKSTLLNIIGLLDTPTSGTVTLLDTDTKGLNDIQLSAFRNKNIGFVFQSFHLIPSLNVMDNVALPLAFRPGLSKSEMRRMVTDVLERLQMSHRMNHRPSQLSGGQCQRVAIARAIVGNPKILLADEPTGNLDPTTGYQIMKLMHKLSEAGTAVLMATHNMQMVEDFPARVVSCIDKKLV